MFTTSGIIEKENASVSLLVLKKIGNEISSQALYLNASLDFLQPAMKDILGLTVQLNVCTDWTDMFSKRIVIMIPAVIEVF